MSDDSNDSLISILENVLLIQFVVSIAGVIMNIPHLFILCQSSMRTSSTNSLMIGIALCDLAVLSVTIHDRINYYKATSDPCFNFDNYYRQLFIWIGDFVRETCESASFWSGVFLALIRLLIMKFPTNTHILSKPLNGYLLVILILAVASLPQAYYYSKYSLVARFNPWKPGKQCERFEFNHSEPSYYPKFESSSDIVAVGHTHVFITGISRILISVIYPFLAIFLLFEIRKSAKFSSTVALNKKASLERHRTGRMILVMTVFYVIASAPAGTSDFITLFVILDADSILITIFPYGYIFLSALVCFNAASHCLINFTMSSKYRATVKTVLGIRKKEIRIPSLTARNTGSSQN